MWGNVWIYLGSIIKALDDNGGQLKGVMEVEEGAGLLWPWF